MRKMKKVFLMVLALSMMASLFLETAVFAETGTTEDGFKYSLEPGANGFGYSMVITGYRCV